MMYLPLLLSHGPGTGSPRAHSPREANSAPPPYPRPPRGEAGNTYSSRANQRALSRTNHNRHRPRVSLAVPHQKCRTPLCPGMTCTQGLCVRRTQYAWGVATPSLFEPAQCVYGGCGGKGVGLLPVAACGSLLERHCIFTSAPNAASISITAVMGGCWGERGDFGGGGG